MKISIISFTKKGADLSLRIKEMLPQRDYECTLYSASSFVSKKEIIKKEGSLEEWCKDRFSEKSAIIFIGAMGIAVRGIAPCIKDKLSDVPVLVLDEKGEFVIPVLSGHVGGANELASFLAKCIKACPVITTATDINSKFSVDLFAKKNNLYISNKDGIAKVSSKVLEGINIRIAVDNKAIGEMEENLPGGTDFSEYKNIENYSDDNVYLGVEFVEYKEDEYYDVLITSDPQKKNADLVLMAKEYVLGIGCKKGKSFEEIDEFVKEILSLNGIDINEVCSVASIDVKKDEDGIKRFCKEYNIPFLTYIADELKEVQGDFETSDFVLENVGVDNVCERAAVKAGEVIAGRISTQRTAFGCKPDSEFVELVVKKQSKDGKTLAVARIKR